MAVVWGKLPGGGNVVHEVWVDGLAQFYPEKEVEARLWRSTDFLQGCVFVGCWEGRTVGANRAHVF